MSRKYPHEYDYQNYKYEYPEDHVSSKRDEYGLYYKKKKKFIKK